MKKLALSLAVLFAVGMVSCGGNKENKEAMEDTMPATEVVEEGVVAVDSVAPDTVAVEEAAVAATDAPAAETEAPAEAPAAENK